MYSTLLHPARQRAHQGILVQVQAVERGLYLVAEVPGVGGIELELDVVHPVHQRLIIFAAELSGQRLVFGQQSLHLAHASRNRIEHRHVGFKMRLLIDIRDLQPLLHHQQAVVELGQAGDDLQQR
jgi:hypothetical protein